MCEERFSSQFGILCSLFFFFRQKCIVYCDYFYYYLLVIHPLFTRAHSLARHLCNTHGHVRLKSENCGRRYRCFAQIHLHAKLCCTTTRQWPATRKRLHARYHISMRFKWRHLFIRKDIFSFTRCWTSINSTLRARYMKSSRTLHFAFVTILGWCAIVSGYAIASLR